MNQNEKEKAKKKLMAAFEKHSGGTKVDPKYTSNDSKALRLELQNSFDSIFPELIKNTKHRKHVIFDDDVYKLFGSVSDQNSPNFSALINSSLRKFAREHGMFKTTPQDLVEELYALREREKSLLKEMSKVKELDLLKVVEEIEEQKHG